ncbi:hypothetical protein [Acanthamoeba castellanii mimivirus]|uniref:Ankyrin repeat protein n=3 Tax=Mimivirus TaxID=315393 RepID=E3VXR3_MIMIV|nr:hypothetical protein MIMI_gp0050 [Acanthamoeba polyphaga mimivirus]AEQ60208.1 hypothetical protein [Acanthamoeba castellanii mamavirus]AHA45844.1 hypothetical protein HIRU_S938 [Hirudovirus strain Sangsue]AHJ39864.1 hypothetical protein [Samba virus]BAV61119.1 hypothetical protein [Acanthamoeba castellanii mimivirus]ADO18186.1 hypothetical protein [Acanthamoeba polyphaga mimivirus]
MEYNGSHKISHETKDNSIIKKLIEKFGYNPNEDDPFYLATKYGNSDISEYLSKAKHNH